ncbi:MAG: hypothetical protein H7245_17490, partial [Candidatus Saccharibacteria bacterium]|nr:hypothetical protein [Pseudorhodobacter sp.]
MKTAAMPLQQDTVVGSQSQPVGSTPHITIHAFCETATVAASARRAGNDRRLARAVTDVSEGGIGAAIAHCTVNPTPDVL